MDCGQDSMPTVDASSNASAQASFSTQTTTNTKTKKRKTPSPTKFILAKELNPNTTKKDIRNSLRGSTLDGVFASIFSNIAGGVLLSNFLLELGADAVQFGLLASIPMLANFLQPLGAYFSERLNSRHGYCLWVYGISRILWVGLALGIFSISWRGGDPTSLLFLTLGITLVTHVSGALGSASWLSWMAALVPQQLRGRYFGFRNSTASLTNLISIPIGGLLVSFWPRGTFEGYGVALSLGILAGMLSLAFQFMMVDINPKEQQKFKLDNDEEEDSSDSEDKPVNPLANFNFLGDKNFVMFLAYFSFWMFAFNLSDPFFNLYMLDDLNIDVGIVTIYGSLMAIAHLLMMLYWGKLADRIGNRALLILLGIPIAITPVLWLITGNNAISIWLWLPLLRIITGGTVAAFDLGVNNIQLDIAPIHKQSQYFAIAAAASGLSGALGTTVGGFLADSIEFGGLQSLFVLSTFVRLAALLPLFFVQEQRGKSLREVMGNLFPEKLQQIPRRMISGTGA